MIPSIAPRGRAPDRLPAHADLVPAQARRADCRRGAPAAAAVPGAQTVGARSLSQAFVEADLPAAGALPRRRCRSRSGGERLGRTPPAPRQVHDPEVRDKLTPRYALGCKRPSFSNDYLPTFNRDNVDARDDADRARSRPTGVRTADGAEHESTCSILATGFKVFETRQHAAVPGRRRAAASTSRQWWDENRFQAYEGVERARASRTSSRSSAPTATTARRTSP